MQSPDLTCLGIFDNINNFYHNRDPYEYFIVRCDDPKKLCGNKYNGRPVGGYAFSVHDNDRDIYFHYIQMCEPYHNTPFLWRVWEDREAERRQNDMSRVDDANWLFNHGQLFLHELMHLKFISDPNDRGKYHPSTDYFKPAKERI